MRKPINNLTKTMFAQTAMFVAISGLHSTSLLAEEKSESLLEEVVVTALRHESNLQDAAVTVNSMSSDFLDKQGINAVNEVLLASPGASFTQFNKMQAEYGLRGVSSQTEGASGDSSVSTIIDNVVISKDFMKNPAFFDMQRVEVLRGPQGTGFGRNASSGLVHLITARPEYETSSGVKVTAGNLGRTSAEAFITGSLSDSAAGRLAINWDTFDGYTEDTRLGDDLGGEENYSIRGSLIFDPTDAVQVYLKAEFNRDNDDTPAIRKGKDCTIPYQLAGAPSVVGAPQPGFKEVPSFTDSCDPFKTQISDRSFSEFYLDRKMVNLTAEVIWSVSEDLSLTSITGWIDGEADYVIDAHGGPNNSMFQNTTNDATMFSQELRFDNQASGDRLLWTLGGYYMHDEHDRFDQNIFFAENSAGGPPGGGTDPNGLVSPRAPINPNGGFFRPETRDIKDAYNETDSLGLFAELSYDLTDDLSITTGIRYSRDEKDYEVAHYGFGWGGPLDTLTNTDANGNSIFGTACAFAPGLDAFLCGTPDSPVGFQTPVKVNDTWDNISAKIAVQYAMNDQQMVYALFSQGYKTGGFQPEPKTPQQALESFDEETVNNFEIGFKGDFGEGFRLNVTAFYSEYDDLQLFLFKNNAAGDFFQAAENAAGVEITGMEADFIWAVNENLRFSGNVALIDAELVDALISVSDDPSVPATDFSGTRPDNTAEWTGTFIVEYDIALNSGGYIGLRADWRGSSEVYDDIGEQKDRRHDAYEVVGMRASWYPADETWEFSLWGKNIFEEEYTVNVGPAQPNVNQLNFGYGHPRTFGVTVNYNFN